MNKKLLLPFDFQQQSLINLHWAKFYAQKTNSKIYLLNIIEEAGFLQELIDQEIENKLKEKAEKKLQDLANNELQNFDYQILIKIGKVYQEIEETANKIKPWSIIMGKDENPSLKKRILGSNTLHTITETDIPVVSIRGENSPQNVKNTILVPIDFRKKFSEQITAAIKYAKLFHSSILILTVNNDKSSAWRTELLVKTNKTKKAIENQNIPVEIKIEEGKPTQKIIEYAEKENPLLTIIMLHDEKQLKNVFIGSTAKEIIENCPAPVMSIKPWEESHTEQTIFKTIFDPLNIF